MKRFTIIALAVLVAFSCLISCSNESASVESQLVSVSFTASQSRSLQEIKPGFVGVRDDSIEWYYKATKAPGSDFLTGQATEWTIIPANTSTTDSVAGKLDNQITFSLGKWDFHLQARLRSNHTTVVYEGFKLGVLLSDANNKSTIDINVSPIIEGQNGYLRLEKVYIKDISGNNVAPNVFKIGDTNYSFTINEDKTISTNDISLPVGSYTIGVGYTADGAVNAAETKTVQIYSGRTTTVIGFVDEQTGLVEFNPISDSGIATPVFNEGSTTTFTINNVSPSMMASTDETPIYTSASFPSGSLTGVTAENATLTVNVNSIDSNFSVGATGGSTAIAGLDISLVVNGQPVTQFNNKNVTITTYIAKGLTGVAVKYNGNGDEPGTVTVTTSTVSSTVVGNYYESDTGKLVFSTNHFSEYYVVADKVVALNASRNIAYDELNEAIEATNSGEVVKLIANYVIPQDVDPIEIGEEKNLTLDLNGKIITENGAGARKIVNWGTLTIRDSATNGEIKNNTVGEPGQDGSYGLIDNYGTLTIENGKFTDVSHGNGSSLRNRRGATLVINGGTFVNTADDSAKPQGGYTGSANAFVYSDGLDVRINGGTFTMTNAHYTPAIKIDGKGTIDGAIISTYKSGGIEVGGEVNIKNTKISVSEANSYYANAIALSNDGKVNVYSGTFTGYEYGTYIYTSGGVINIYDGIFEAGTAVLRADKDMYEPYGSNINVYGGNFTGEYKINANAKLTITGGTFSSDPSEYVDTANYNVTDNGSTWTVTAK